MKFIINGLIISSILVLLIYQKIQNTVLKKKTTVLRNTDENKSNDLTEILQSNKEKIQINLPNKLVHIKREFIDALFLGQIIFEKYKVVGILNIGHMSHVYRVKHLIIGNYWCLKIITTYDNTGLFQEEGILRQMNYQRIPKIIDVYYKGNLVYIIEEYIEGTSLEDLLEEKGHFSERQLIKWGIELCEIFEYLHDGLLNPIIYRDLKPDNIIVTQNRHLVLIDFGLSKFKTSKERDLIASGTRDFAPKEQFSEKAITDELTDLYSIGMNLIYLILENITNTSITLKELMKFMSKDFSMLLLKSIQDNRNERYQSVRRFKDDLEMLLYKKQSIIKEKRVKIIIRVLMSLYVIYLIKEGYQLFL